MKRHRDIWLPQSQDVDEFRRILTDNQVERRLNVFHPIQKMPFPFPLLRLYEIVKYHSIKECQWKSI